MDLQDVGSSAGLTASTFGEWEIGPTPPLEPGIIPLTYYYAGARTKPAQMPKSGLITYTGKFVGQFFLGQNYFLGGIVSVTVNYATGVKTVNGTISSMNVFIASTGANLGTTNGMAFQGTLNSNVFSGLSQFTLPGGTSGIDLHKTFGDGIPFNGLFYGATGSEMAGCNSFGVFGVHE